MHKDQVEIKDFKINEIEFFEEFKDDSDEQLDYYYSTNVFASFNMNGEQFDNVLFQEEEYNGQLTNDFRVVDPDLCCGSSNERYYEFCNQNEIDGYNALFDQGYSNLIDSSVLSKTGDDRRLDDEMTSFAIYADCHEKEFNLKTNEAALKLKSVLERGGDDAEIIFNEDEMESDYMKSAIAWTKGVEKSKDGDVKVTSDSSVKTLREMKQSVVDARAAKQ